MIADYVAGAADRLVREGAERGDLLADDVIRFGIDRVLDAVLAELERQAERASGGLPREP